MSNIDNKFWEEFFNSGDKLELEIADYQKIDKSRELYMLKSLVWGIPKKDWPVDLKNKIKKLERELKK